MKRRPPLETIKKALWTTNIRTGIPRVKIDQKASRLEGVALSLALEYVDSKAEPIDDSQFYALDERHLGRLPELISAVFAAREELAEIRLSVLDWSETIDDDGARVVTHEPIQRFKFGRSRMEHVGDDERARWKELLSTCDPEPSYPPPSDVGSFGWVFAMVWIGILAAIGVAAWIVVRARRFGPDTFNPVDGARYRAR